MKAVRSVVVMDYSKLTSLCNRSYLRGFVAGAMFAYTMTKAFRVMAEEKSKEKTE